MDGTIRSLDRLLARELVDTIIRLQWTAVHIFSQGLVSGTASFASLLRRVVTTRRATLLARRRFIRGRIAARIREDNDPVDLVGSYGVSTRYLDRDSGGDVIGEAYLTGRRQPTARAVTGA